MASTTLSLCRPFATELTLNDEITIFDETLNVKVEKKTFPEKKIASIISKNDTMM